MRTARRLFPTTALNGDRSTAARPKSFGVNHDGAASSITATIMTTIKIHD
jgi:hypothetical protein